MRRTITAVACLLLLVSCGSSEAPSGDGPEASGRAPMVTCGSHGRPFWADALQAETGAETADTPQAAGLRDVVALPGLQLPAEGWRVLAQDESRAMYAATVSDGFAIVSLRLDGQRWVFDGSGGCPLERIMVVPADGLRPAVWWLDPAAGDQRGSSTVRVLATDVSCASGRPTGDRLRTPTVIEDDSQVVIAFTATPVGGQSQTCQGHPPTPYEVELDSDLGSRELLDGAYWPPREPRPY